MSELSAFKQVNYFPQQETAQYSVLGYGSVGVSLSGSIDAGGFKFYGSNDGIEWTELQCQSGGNMVTDNLIFAPGNYVTSAVSYDLIQLAPSDDFSGNITASASVSPMVPPPFIVGFA